MASLAPTVDSPPAARDLDAVVDAFSLRLQRESAGRAVWFTITNELARIVACDRVTLVTAERGWRVQAVSNVDTLDRRAPVVRSMEVLAASIGQDRRAVWMHGAEEAEALGAAPTWRRFMEEGTARSAALIPLLDAATTSATTDDQAGDPVVVGAVVLERFSEQPFTLAEQSLVERLCRHAAAGVVRTSAVRQRSWLSKLAGKPIILGVLILGASVGGAMIPIDFQVTASGELQPRSRQDIFAPADGLVRQLHVREGEAVATGELLLEMTNDDLEFELTRLAGELQTARRQLIAVQAARLDASSDSPARERRGQLTAEEERLKQVVLSLQQQQQQLASRREQLSVRSPLAGRIVTGNIDQLLRARPLRRGQRLFTIVDDRGAWMLELEVADQDVGHVLAAQQSQPSVPLKFVLATDPTVTRTGTIERIADWTDLERTGTPSVRVTARPDGLDGLAVRPGASVTAKIWCGRRAVGYVWLRDLIELVRWRLLF